MNNTYKPARLVFEMAEDVIFPGYVTGKQWNGFEDAYFNPEVWQRVIDWFNRDDPDPEHIEADIFNYGFPLSQLFS